MKSPATVLFLCLAVFALGLALGQSAVGEDDPAPEPATDGAFTSFQKGDVALKEGFRAKHTKVKLGDLMKGTASLEIREWFGAKAITGQLDITNPTDKDRFLSYNLAFFDKDGVLMGSASQHMKIDAGESTSIGGAIILLPKAELAKVTSYQIAYYEDDQEVGKR